MKYFTPYELVSRAVFEKVGENVFDLFDDDALQALDDLREYFSCPIIVNNWHSGGEFQRRGFRTHAEQRAVNPKAMRSAHLYGKAFDCDIQGHTAEQARHKIMSNQDSPLLCRIMRLEADVSWLHFDVLELPKGIKRIHLFKA